MGKRWLPLAVSALMVAASMAFVWLWAVRPADCARVDVRAKSWAAGGVVVDAPKGCALHTGDLVTAVAGRPLGAGGTAFAPRVGDQLDYTLVRDGVTQTIPVTLGRADLPATLAPTWPTLLFVVALLGVAAYAAVRRPTPATAALLVLGAGFAASTVPTLLGIPVVAVLDPAARWLYLGLTHVVYLAGWSGGVAFILLFPHRFTFLGRWPGWARGLMYGAPLGLLVAWSAVAVPVSVDSLDWTRAMIAGAGLVVVASVLTMLVLMVLRMGRADDAMERQQLRWLAGGGMLSGATGLAGWFLPGVLVGQSLPTGWIGLSGLPFVLGLAVAVTRHHLFDLDLVLRLTLVYGLLTAAVVSVYVLAVVVVAAMTRESATASVLAAAAVAVAVNPLRIALQRAISRLLYGQRDEPYAALRRLDRRLDAAADPDRLLPEIAEGVTNALRVPYVAIEVDGMAGMVGRAEAGAAPRWLRDGNGLVELPLADRGMRLGRLLVSPRTAVEPLSRADLQVLDDLTRRVSTAVTELRLRADPQRSREQLVLAREEERRRLRRTLHDEVGPTVAGLGLQTEAARRLIATDPRGADAALLAIQERSQGLVTDIRELAYNLRPPALDELGLAAALRRYADGIPEPVVVVEATADLANLPAAVESAAYRIAVEAVRNAVRHAGASRCTVALHLLDGALEVRITDNGRGLPTDLQPGVGISGMRERAAELGGRVRFAQVTTGGTAVVAVLPLRPIPATEKEEEANPDELIRAIHTVASGVPGHAPGMPIHHDLHVWIWADNPAGLFAQWNPSVSC